MTGSVYRHGPPRIFTSDQALNVDGEKVRALLEKLGVEKRHSSPYHPQGDGQAERGVRNVTQIMRCLLSERNIGKNDWHILLPEVNYLINTVPSSSTKFTLYKVFYGTEAKHISTAAVELGIPSHYESVQDWIQRIMEAENLINQSVTDNLERAQDIMKKSYDTASKPLHEITVGDLVLVKDETRKDCLEPIYKGPYRVLKRVGPNIKILVDGQKEKVIHLNRCKRHCKGLGSLELIDDDWSTSSDPETQDVIVGGTPYPEESEVSDPESIEESGGTLGGDLCYGDTANNLRRS